MQQVSTLTLITWLYLCFMLSSQRKDILGISWFESKGRIQPVRLGGGQFQQYLAVKSHYQFTPARDMKYALRHCCDKTIDVRIAAYHECCFPNCTKSWWKKLVS